MPTQKKQHTDFLTLSDSLWIQYIKCFNHLYHILVKLFGRGKTQKEGLRVTYVQLQLALRSNIHNETKDTPGYAG